MSQAKRDHLSEIAGAQATFITHKAAFATSTHDGIPPFSSAQDSKVSSCCILLVVVTTTDLRVLSNEAMVQDNLEWNTEFSWEMGHSVGEAYEDDLGKWFPPGPVAR